MVGVDCNQASMCLILNDHISFIWIMTGYSKNNGMEMDIIIFFLLLSDYKKQQCHLLTHLLMNTGLNSVTWYQPRYNLTETFIFVFALCRCPALEM
ncbi:hypothetical protein FKM82_016642 [Ascaphus truei]